MSRRPAQRLDDIIAAADAIAAHLQRGRLDDVLVFDFEFDSSRSEKP